MVSKKKLGIVAGITAIVAGITGLVIRRKRNNYKPIKD